MADKNSNQKDFIDEEHFSSFLYIVNGVASILLEAEVDEFDKALLYCMGMMCDSVNVDRMYIWRNHSVDGKLYCTQIYEWSETAEPQQSNEYTTDISYSENMPTWEEKLSVGECINGIVREMDASTQAQLSPQGILSILVVPVFLRDNFWGFVGFDDCNRERVFSKNEETILRSGSLLIAHAMLRNDLTLGIRATATELESALKEAQAASRAKSIFLSNMSHEMRTPMNAIIGMTEIGKSASNMEKKNYAFEKIEHASNHLLGVINDVLDVSKIEAGEFELSGTVFEFEDMIQKAINISGFRIEEKRQNFTINMDKSIPKIFYGDSVRLTQVMSNLLSNAVKFTPERGSVSLKAEKIEEIDGICTLRIEVKDTGIGISREEQSHLFEAFSQVESGSSRKFGGTGLGLVICKRIVELMGGRIWIESERGKGAAFLFTVQLMRCDEDGEEIPEEILHEEIPSFKGRQILLAEDVEINREIVLSLLEPVELKIDCAINGAEAVDMFCLNPERYEMIFMDMQMPQMDGLEATRCIREFEKNLDPALHKPIPIVAMTANVFKEDVEKCLDAGMNAHVGKPLDFSEVVEMLKRFLPDKEQ